MFSESIARKLKLSANKDLAQRYERRVLRAREIRDLRGRPVEVVNTRRAARSNGLLDE